MLPTTPSLGQGRTEIASAIKAAADAWAVAPGGYALPIQSENRDVVDLSSGDAEKPFLSWEIKFGGAHQGSLGAQPLVRQLGQVFLAVKVKEGAGSAGCLALADFLVPYLERKALGVVQTEVVSVQTPVPIQGFYTVPMLVNFWIDRISQ